MAKQPMNKIRIRIDKNNYTGNELSIQICILLLIENIKIHHYSYETNISHQTIVHHYY